MTIRVFSALNIYYSVFSAFISNLMIKYVILFVSRNKIELVAIEYTYCCWALLFAKWLMKSTSLQFPLAHFNSLVGGWCVSINLSNYNNHKVLIDDKYLNFLITDHLPDVLMLDEKLATGRHKLLECFR